MSTPDATSHPAKRTRTKSPLISMDTNAHETPKDAEIIEISSDTEEEDPVPRAPRPRKKGMKRVRGVRNHKSSSVFLNDKDDVECEAIPALKREVQELRLQSLRLQQMARESELKLIDALQENKRLKRQAQSNIAVKLEELTCCDICTMTMWQPNVLSQCGHTFCSSCLEAWFRSALEQHKQKYPHWTPHIHIPYMHGLVDHVVLQQYLHMERQRNPPPTYHCPTCRVVVTRKPTEDFKLKELIHTVATTRGEEPPPAAPRYPPGRDMWDIFFRAIRP